MIRPIRARPSVVARASAPNRPGRRAIGARSTLSRPAGGHPGVVADQAHRARIRALVPADLAESPGRYCRGRPAGRGASGTAVGRQHRDHAHAEVERQLELGARARRRARRTRSKIGCGAQVARSTGAREPGRQHPGQVAGQPAAGDVRERPGAALGGQGEAVEGVDPGRGRAARRPGCGRRARPGRSSSASPRALEQHVPHQRVAVGVHARTSPSRSARRPAGPGRGRAPRRR